MQELILTLFYLLAGTMITSYFLIEIYIFLDLLKLKIEIRKFFLINNLIQFIKSYYLDFFINNRKLRKNILKLVLSNEDHQSIKIKHFIGYLKYGKLFKNKSFFHFYDKIDFFFDFMKLQKIRLFIFNQLILINNYFIYSELKKYLYITEPIKLELTNTDDIKLFNFLLAFRLSKSIGTSFEEVQNSLMLELMYSEMLRPSEIINIKLNDIDTKNNYITIYPTNKKRGIRIVSLNIMSSRIMNKYLQLYKKKFKNAKIDLLFIHKLKKPFNEEMVMNNVKLKILSLGINIKVNSSTLRNNFAISLFEFEDNLEFIYFINSLYHLSEKEISNYIEVKIAEAQKFKLKQNRIFV